MIVERGWNMKALDDFEPLSYYKEVLKDSFRKNAEECFDALVKKSGIDAEENKRTVARYNAASAKVASAKKKLDSCKLLRGITIFFLIAAVIAGIVLILSGAGEGGAWWLILIGALCLALAVVLLVLLCTKIKNILRIREQKYNDAVAKANAILEEAWAQMRPLLKLFTQDMTRALVEKTYPDVRIDDHFDMRKFELMSRKYGLGENDDTSSSTVCVLSGTADQSPFLYVRDYNCHMYTHTYQGSLVIHWVTYTYDSKGRRRAVHHTQTLTATYSAPAPSYGYNTRLYYGNEAAPDLSFSRQPAYTHTLSEAQVERKVKKGRKRLQKKARRAIEEGGSFTEMGNAEFDVLFGATDRDNEVQFRLMFTPLAQKNLISLIRSNEAYGDDFSFVKKRMLNCIRSEHAQHWQIEPDVKRYHSYDLAVCRRQFVDQNCEYFRSLYFDLAPLQSIPLYQMTKPKEFIYRHVYYRNCTSFETEALANRFPARYFAHKDTKTDVILKTQFVQKDGLADKVRVNAYSFDAVPRVAYISVAGGDGLIHSVPVEWTEYIPLQKTSVMEIKAVGGTTEEYLEKNENGPLRAFVGKYADTSAFGKGLLAIPILHGTFDAASDGTLNQMFGIRQKNGWSETADKIAEALGKAEEAEEQLAAAEAEEVGDALETPETSVSEEMAADAENKPRQPSEGGGRTEDASDDENNN